MYNVCSQTDFICEIGVSYRWILWQSTCKLLSTLFVIISCINIQVYITQSLHRITQPIQQVSTKQERSIPKFTCKFMLWNRSATTAFLSFNILTQSQVGKKSSQKIGNGEGFAASLRSLSVRRVASCSRLQYWPGKYPIVQKLAGFGWIWQRTHWVTQHCDSMFASQWINLQTPL